MNTSLHKDIARKEAVRFKQVNKKTELCDLK